MKYSALLMDKARLEAGSGFSRMFAGSAIGIGIHDPKKIVGMRMLLRHLYQDQEEYDDKRGIAYLLVQERGIIISSAEVQSCYSYQNTIWNGKADFVIRCTNTQRERTEGVETFDSCFGWWNPYTRKFEH